MDYKSSKEQEVYIEALRLVKLLESKRKIDPLINNMFISCEGDLAVYAMQNEDKIWNN